MIDPPDPLSDDAGLQRVREGVLGAPVAPHLTVIEGGSGEGSKNATEPVPAGGGGGRRGAAVGEVSAESTCPLVCLGHAAGVFYFLDIDGQQRELKARALSTRGDLVSLFLGDTRWLLDWFPDNVGFAVAKAGERLMAMCRAAGLFGAHVVLRGPGVWPGADGAPIVHCGDLVMIDGTWSRAGFRVGDLVWVQGARRVRPGAVVDGVPLALAARGFAADAAIGRGIQEDIVNLWEFDIPGSAMICLGLMAVGYFGTAARWRPNGYLVGGTGSGKSMLLHLLRACVPGSEYSTDTSKAGIEGAINGKPTPVYLDEAGDRQGLGAAMLLDVVLSATGGDGTRGLRGAADGGSRSFQAACSVIMAAVSPPPMGPQHRDRFTIVPMVKPGAGVDHLAPMEEATRRAAKVAPLLWGRALLGWPRWGAARLAFRDALSRVGCAARELDQMGPILAGWWILTEDGVPSAEVADGSVAAVAGFVRGAEDVAAEDGPRRLLQFLASTTVQRDRSTDIEQIGVLVEKAWGAYDEGEREAPQRLLERYGIRVVRDRDDKTGNGKRIPRGDAGDGMWFSRSAETLRALFKGSAHDGDRWAYELLRHRSAVASKRTVRVGGVTGPAIWLSRRDWLPAEVEEEPAPQAPGASRPPSPWVAPVPVSGPPDEHWYPPPEEDDGGPPPDE